MWYIFNKNNQCIGKCSIKPNIDDLATRGQRAVFSEKPISLYEPEKPKQIKIESIRAERNKLIKLTQEKIDRYNNQSAINIVTTDSPEKIKEIYLYMQELREFPNTCDIDNPIWPTSPF